MIIRLLTLLLIFSSFNVPSAKDELVPWSKSRKLTWDDFKASPDKNSDNAALTSSAIGFGWGYDEKGFSYTIECTFNKQKSWGRIKNDHILGHEQGHFDITEIYARKLKKALTEYKFNKNTANKGVQEMYSKLMNEQIQMQTTYDRETAHSKKIEEQKQWLIKIEKELNELEAYSKY